ncbi:hypothetical protein [Lentilactobacillus parabuchneri]|uniref:hypothetical protein n=1 Tax=Lentilactobacillus parabuchneri TaxID=152331 RepID=UPI002307F794|nr:hypothetical protein [Lentilactobacillus parabuchneri]MDB1104787.1 hypothetical protein [Lentilactobacillus parabuchneri]
MLFVKTILILLFQLSALAFGAFLVKFSIDWGRNETLVGKAFVFSIGGILACACFLIFLAGLYML